MEKIWVGVKNLGGKNPKYGKNMVVAGGDQSKIPGTYGGVGGWSRCQFWDFSDLFWGFFPQLFV